MKKEILFMLILLPVLLFAQEMGDAKSKTQDGLHGLSIERLWQLADSSMTTNPGKSLIFINRSLFLAQESSNYRQQVLSLNRLSALQLQRGQLEQALATDQKALLIYRLQPDLDGHIEALHNKTLVYDRMIRSMKHAAIKERNRDIRMFTIFLLFISLLFLGINLMKSYTTRRLIKANREIHHKNLELSNTNQILDLIARKDPLTNLSNRRDMLEKMKYARIAYERNHKTFLIMMLDIDFFKNINDTYGHDAGDFILNHLSSLMLRTLRKQDIISRWGGDEFLLLLPETEAKYGLVVAEKIRTRIEKEDCIFGLNHIKISVSIGVSCFTDSSDLDICMKHADEALYISKEKGRNRATMYEACVSV